MMEWSEGPKGPPGSNVTSVETITVVRVEAVRGVGTPEDPCRAVVEYWSTDGRFLAQDHGEEARREFIHRMVEEE